MRILLIIPILSFLSCQLKDKTQDDDEHKERENRETLVLQAKIDSATMISTKIPHSFFDSILGKFELTFQQVKKYTMIDSVYYTGMFSDVVFLGDTVFNFRAGNKGVIIRYDDKKSCIYKFLLVFDLNNDRNIDSKIIYSDCDHDESVDYSQLRYNLLNDSIFETIETYIPAVASRDVQRIKSERIKWKLTKDGIIDSAQ